MTINAKIEAQIRNIFEYNLLDDYQLKDERPWGEDGNMDAFAHGKEYGSHYLAEEGLKLLDKKNAILLKELLSKNLLDEERLEDDMPWGEDSVLYAFDNGKEFGAHDLAEEILELLQEN